VRIIIKPHHSYSESEIKMAFGDEWPEQFEFAETSFGECAKKAYLLITGNSSVSIEFLARGKPIIIIGILTGSLTCNLISDTIDRKIWRLCYTEDELDYAIQYFVNLEPKDRACFKEIGNFVREQYFEPVTKELSREFLHL